MDDRYSQFLICVGDMCTTAELANLHVEVLTGLGQRMAGVPSAIRPAAGSEQVDDSGYARRFRIDGWPVNLDDIIECVVHAPQRPE